MANFHLFERDCSHRCVLDSMAVHTDRDHDERSNKQDPDSGQNSVLIWRKQTTYNSMAAIAAVTERTFKYVCVAIA